MADQEAQAPLIEPPQPLAVADLGSNGGVFSPTTVSEAVDWLQREVNFWAWQNGINPGNYKSGIDKAFAPLHEAHQAASEALKVEKTNPQVAGNVLRDAASKLTVAYVTRGVPHSSTPLAHRIDAIKEENRSRAIAYLYASLKTVTKVDLNGDIDSWRGFVLGILDRDELDKPDSAVAAQAAALDELRQRGEALVGEKSSALADLQRRFVILNEDMRSATTTGERSLDELLANKQKEMADAVKSHGDQMSSIQAAFREQMALRAPVEYWEQRNTHHRRRTVVLGRWAFGSMFVLAGGMVAALIWVQHNLNDKAQPDVWRIGALLLLGVVGVWAVRLIVRMFLSHIHLSTDAAERVTMVKTYLSLVEAGGTLGDEDRKVILQAIFRPASDGLVKDEGLPHPMLELLTRTGAR